jgi:hypothetical protein
LSSTAQSYLKLDGGEEGEEGKRKKKKEEESKF